MIGPFTNEYSFLSNFWLCPTEFEGTVYPSVESAYQAAKTLDLEVRRLVFSQAYPAFAKREGRKLELREDWEDVKRDVMLRCLRSKFQDPTLREELLATGDEELVEVNWWHDTYWGVCNGVGKNHLGRLLMTVRDEVRDERGS